MKFIWCYHLLHKMSQDKSSLIFCSDCYGFVESHDGKTCDVCGHQPSTARVKRSSIIKILPLMAIACSGAASADSGCPELYLAKEAPALIAPLNGDFYEVCNEEYAVYVSALNKSAIYAVERLTPAQVRGAGKISRGNTEFYEETRLPVPMRMSPESYGRSGYDRGHLAPAGDFSSTASQAQSFSMANVVPQSPSVNRGIWADVERTVRYLASKGPVNVVTGPLYFGKTQYLGQSGMPIPSNIFKAVYAPASNAVGVYLVANDGNQNIGKLSLTQFRTLTGMDVFPSLPVAVKDIRGAIPTPIQVNWQ